MKKTLLKLSIFIALLCTFNCENTDDAPPIHPENLIAYYPFNGNANDAINSNDGFVNGALLTENNNAFSFDGIDDSITIAHTALFNLEGDFTISALIKTNEIKSQTIIRKGPQVNGDNNSPFALSLSQTNDIIFSIASANGNIITEVRKTGYTINTYYVLTGVYKDNNLYLYVNGVLEDTAVSDGSINTNDSALLIGTRLNLPSSTFNGTIDDIRIYNIALSEIIISELLEN